MPKAKRSCQLEINSNDWFRARCREAKKCLLDRTPLSRREQAASACSETKKCIPRTNSQFCKNEKAQDKLDNTENHIENSPKEASNGRLPSEQSKFSLGMVEPHKELLNCPPEDQLIYKIISKDYFLDSLNKAYLYFNRVDSYKDFTNADKYDGQQLPQDLSGNQSSKFVGAKNFSVADYYDQSRSRTYACCFSTSNSNHIWEEYGGESEKICLVFNFGNLRSFLNNNFHNIKCQTPSQAIMLGSIFSLNYGLVEYIDTK